MYFKEAQSLRETAFARCILPIGGCCLIKYFSGERKLLVMELVVKLRRGLKTLQKHIADKHLASSEQEYYATFFAGYYPHCMGVLPGQWMPNFVRASDPSARTLSVYVH